MTTCIAPRCGAPREIGALFCGRCMKAPAAQRGGWLSAEKRRRALVANKESSVDVSNVVTRLWLGSKPPFDRDLPEFEVLVLCAQELQPERIGFRRQVIHVPIPDAPLTNTELKRALLGGRAVAKALSSGGRVLVTCAAGLNRSALVAGFAMGLTTHMSATEIIMKIRERRAPAALHNPHFCGYLQKFIGAGRRPVAAAR